MTKAKLKAYRGTLVALHERLQKDASQLQDEALKSDREAGGNLSHTPIHMADLGTDSFDQQFTLSLLENEEQILEEIASALERIEQGNFGRCEECQREIPKARLEAIPYARYCVDCASNGRS